MVDKPIYWVGSSKIDISNFSEEARRKAGFQLRAVQQGQAPTDFKPMPIVGKGVEEIRIRTDVAYRVFYVAKERGSCLCASCFSKKDTEDFKTRPENWTTALSRNDSVQTGTTG